MKSKAQRRSRRWAFCLWLCFVGSNAYSEESECERLPVDRQATCRKVVSCLAIDDSEKSQACLRTASQINEIERPHGSPPKAEKAVSIPSYEDIAIPTEQTSSPVESKAPVSKKRSRFNVFRRNDDREKEPRRRRIFKRDGKPEEDDKSEETVTKITVERSVLSIPKRYTGEVTALKNLVRDRQLIALDNELLFEAELAPGGKLKVGDHVRVTRISSFLGNRFQLIGPNRRPVNATRIRCERVKEELNPQNRNRCLLLSNSGELENN